MKLKVWTLVIAALLNVFLAASPFIPGIKQIWQQADPQVFYATLASLVGVDFVLLTLAMGLLLIYEGRDLKAMRTEMLERIQGARVVRQSGADFYKAFAAACRGAQYSVSISYLAASPPDQGAREYQDKYYDEHVKMIKRFSDVTYKRLIRESDANKEWVLGLIAKLEGKSNAFIAIVKDLGAEHEMPLALSVQIVDDSKVWLVALKSHLPEGQYRDVYIESRDVTSAMTEYYDRLWSMSTVLLRAGIVTGEGHAYRS